MSSGRRRLHERYRGSLTVQLERDGVRRFATIYDMSRGGAFLEIHPAPPPGTSLTIFIARPDGRALSFPCEARHSRFDRDLDLSGVGVAWGDLDDEARAYLDELLARAAAAQRFRG